MPKEVKTSLVMPLMACHIGRCYCERWLVDGSCWHSLCESCQKSAVVVLRVIWLRGMWTAIW